MGRNKKIPTPKIFDKLVDEYFKTAEVPTLNGLVLHLGFFHKSNFYKYQEYEEYKKSVQRARTLLEKAYEEKLLNKPVGAIFALKNFGWTDRQEVITKSDISTIEEYDDIVEDIKRLKEELNIE